MQTLLSIVSPWQQLKGGKVSCAQALSLLVNEVGVVKLDLLYPEVRD
jgi:hypothetical protein